MNSDKESKYLKIALLVAGLVLCIGVIPVVPYGYFTFLRLVVCAAAVYAAVLTRAGHDLEAHFIPLVMLALLFNPIAPVMFDRAFWILIDMGTAGYFLFLAKKI